MIFLRSVRLERKDELPAVYPFAVPAISTLTEIVFREPVTFFAGGNGTGKSTLLEAVAVGIGSTPVRSGQSATENSLLGARELSRSLRFTWQTRTHTGFFLREEDFFEYKKELAGTVTELGSLADDYEERFEGMSRTLSMGVALGQKQAFVERYGHDLDAMSHGESLLQFFRARFREPGLYLLDEPDTALSPQSVLGLLAFLKEMAEGGSQFIIATHSPILLALPDAQLVSFDRTPVSEVMYDELEQVVLLRDFLNHPTAFLRHL